MKLSIAEARQSDVWARLGDSVRAPAPIERCSELPIHLAGPSAEEGAWNPLGLPTQDFTVVCSGVTIRAEASSAAPVCGAKRMGDRFSASEETFDGWIKLADEVGWIHRAAEGSQAPSSSSSSSSAPLKPVGGLETLSKALASPTPAHVPGRQMFEVAADAGAPVFREPSVGALHLGVRSCGEFILAEGQSYHGWVRLSDDEGWMPAFDASSGSPMLVGVRPDELQITQAFPSDQQPSGEDAIDKEAAVAAAAAEAVAQAGRREALRALELAAASGAPSAVFCATMEVARQRGVSKRDIARCNGLRSGF